MHLRVTLQTRQTDVKMGSIFYFYLNEQLPPFKDDFLEAIDVTNSGGTETKVRVKVIASSFSCSCCRDRLGDNFGRMCGVRIPVWHWKLAFSVEVKVAVDFRSFERFMCIRTATDIVLISTSCAMDMNSPIGLYRPVRIVA